MQISIACEFSHREITSRKGSNAIRPSVYPFAIPAIDAAAASEIVRNECGGGPAQMKEDRKIPTRLTSNALINDEIGAVRLKKPPVARRYRFPVDFDPPADVQRDGKWRKKSKRENG